MNWRKNIVLIVGGAICLVLFIVAAVFLVRFRSDYKVVSGKVKVAQDRLDQLNRRDPFPSDENVSVERTNLVALQTYFATLMDNLQRDQAAPEAIEAAEFAPMLEKAKQRIMKGALEAGVKVPDRSGLGFARYAAGDLPSAAAIPRLVVQLRAVESVLTHVFDARVAEITSIERDIFEAPAETADAGADTHRRSRGQATEAATPAKTLEGMPALETNELYSAERIYVSFSGRESSLWALLNSLAMSKPFIVVEDVRVQNTLDLTKKAAAPATTPTAAGAKPVVPDREERIVAGREPVKVEMVLDVYRFNGVTPQEAKK